MEELRPDLAYIIGRNSNVRGFKCHECGWSAYTIPMESVTEEFGKTLCPECGEAGVENRLETDSNEILEAYDEHKYDDGWVDVAVLRSATTLHDGRFDTVLNNIITDQEAYILFEQGGAIVNIES